MDCLQFIWTRFLNFRHLIGPEVILWNWKKKQISNWTETALLQCLWNKLDEDTVCASSLNCFKQYIQKLYQDGSSHRLLQSIWPKRLSQFPLGRARLVSYLVRYCGGWPRKREGVGLIVRAVTAVSFQNFQPVWPWSTNVTDRQRTCDRNTALCTIAADRAVIKELLLLLYGLNTR